jgi:hypothetical protein
MHDTTQTTVLFEDPYWIALIERQIDGHYSVARIIISTSEPSGADLIIFFNHLNFENIKFSKPVKAESIVSKEVSFKKQLHKNKVSQNSTLRHTYTKAQAMLKQQQTEIKTEKKHITKVDREIEMQFKFELLQQKRKEKHKGH